MKRIYLSKNKKAQGVFGLSFSVIFSIFLIIFFVIIAFIVIKSFLGTQKCAQVALFKDDFQNEIKKAWNSPLQISTFKGRLPSKIEYVCFANFSKPISGRYNETGDDISIYEGETANLFLYPVENTCDLPYHNIKYLDLNKILSQRNPHCIEVVKGNVDIEIKKELGDRYVCLGENCGEA
jgi:hypothetical protein